MKTVKSKDKKKMDMAPAIESYSNYKGTEMVRISGNFFGQGFFMSKNKVKAVLGLASKLKPFIDGKFDARIAKLKKDEVLEV